MYRLEYDLDSVINSSRILFFEADIAVASLLFEEMQVDVAPYVVILPQSIEGDINPSVLMAAL